MNTSRVLKLSETILKKPRYLGLDRAKKISEVAFQCRDMELSIPTYDYPGAYPQSDDFEEMSLFYLVFNAINYCYFDQFGNRFAAGEKSGSTLASTRLAYAWEEIRDPMFLANIDENYLLSELFAAEIPISLVKERTAALREIGTFINQNFDFTFEKLFLKYRRDAYLVSQMLPTLLPTWRDPFFKRSQLFVSMVYGRFQNRGFLPISTDSLDNLTVFADYKVPQSLFAFKIIHPSQELSEHICQKKLIPAGSQMELEIRAATIVVSQLLLEDLQKYRKDPTINSLHVDYLLWAATKGLIELPEKLLEIPDWPHHLTMTTDY